MTVTRELPWKKITAERYREYIFFIDGVFAHYRIEEPIAVAMSSNGHRVFNRAGENFYVPKGYIAIKWEGYTKGEPQYAF